MPVSRSEQTDQPEHEPDQQDPQPFLHFSSSHCKEQPSEPAETDLLGKENQSVFKSTFSISSRSTDTGRQGKSSRSGD